MTPAGQPLPKKGKSLKADAQELVLCDNTAFACETYIFDPSTGEEHLGYLFAAAETEARGGIGKELLDMVVAAVQNEYYRDTSRSPVHSFELALHQANLILHDAVEKGVKDWMGYFNVAIAVLVNEQLHVSVAGEASAWLTRRGLITNVSEGLSHLPITNPLRTFSQVASGELKPRDTIFLATANFTNAFRPQDAARFTIDHSAQTIVSRLMQLYRDQREEAPLSLVAVSVLPEYVVEPKAEIQPTPYYRPRANATVTPEQLKPRKPLVINRPGWHQTMAIIFGLLKTLFGWLKKKLWPVVKQGGVVVGSQAKKGGTALWNMSKQRGQQLLTRNRPAVTETNVPERSFEASRPAVPLKIRAVSFGQKIWQTLKRLPVRLATIIMNLPLTSKIFGVVALVLMVVLFFSLHFLQSKRAADQDIQHASELLHDAQTKIEAAKGAIATSNRAQAETLLKEAGKEADKLTATTLYQEDTKKLRETIATQMDRLQKITRATSASLPEVGDFASQAGSETLTSLFMVGDTFYTFNPKTNAILAMDAKGVTSMVSSETKEIGSFTGGTAHAADKIIFLTSNDGGVALFDTKDNSLSKQDIHLNGDKPTISQMAVFGNRLYTYEPTAKTIVTYNKTLRGFTGGTAWITDPTFPATNIVSFGIDGNIFTLQKDGSLRQLFKGKAVDFTQDTVSPSLTGATKLFINENTANIYVLDARNKRVVVFTKKGALVKQLFFDAGIELQDITVDQKEEKLFVLAGTKVFALNLTEPATK